jgi:hypothetical protein
MVQVHAGQTSDNKASPVYLVEGPGIPETTFPYIVNHLLCMSFVFACWSCSNRKNSSSSDTFLMLLGQFPLASPKEFSCPSAFTT